ncbi:MAG: hypothetical protein NTW16_18135, partial [Bacteroidetes bacterium]|nr:hypothetical protein [Bacteroidota bacterium]
MKQLFAFLCVMLMSGLSAFAQVGINTDGSVPNNSAMLDVKSSNRGLLPPRMTHTEINAIVNPANGLIVYCTDCGTDGNGAFFGYIKGTWNSILTCIPPETPAAGTNVPAEDQVVWNWNTVPGAIGYRWNTSGSYATATDVGVATTKTETGLICNTPYARYVWAYNACGISAPVTLSQTTIYVAPAAPATGTHTASPVQIVWIWNTVIGATGYKWNTTNNYGTATDMGMVTAKTETGLTCNTAYTRYVWAYSACGNSLVTILTQSTSMNGAANVTIAVSANPVCSGTSVTFTATPVNGGATPAYQWIKGATNISGATNATYSYIPAASDAVSCRMTSSTPCSLNNPATSNTVTMTVNPLQVVGVSIAASANPVCAGTSVTFTATPSNGGTTPLYQWKKGGTNITGATNVTYSYIPLTGDAITCQLTSNATCPSGNPATSNTVTMTVNPLQVV